MMTASINRAAGGVPLRDKLLAEQRRQKDAILQRIEAADKLPAEARDVALAIAEVDLADVGQNLEILSRVLPNLK